MFSSVTSSLSMLTKILLVLSTRLVVMNSLGLRSAGTVILGTFWFAFIVLFLAFFAGNMDFWQKLAVFIASASIAGGLTAVMWIRWALK